MSTVHIEYIPDPRVFQQALVEVETALEHVEVPLAFAKEQVQADVRERFTTETDPDGNPWQSWSAIYTPYALSFPNVGILQQTGDLMKAATRDSAYIISGNTLFFEGGDLPHAGWAHQEGALRTDAMGDTINFLPPRPFLGLSEEAKTLIFATFTDWFDRSIDIFKNVAGRMQRRHALRGPTGFIPRAVRMPVRIG